MSAAASSAATASSSSDLRTPREWAIKNGHLTKARVQQPTIENPTHPFYAAAAQLHGWAKAEHHLQGKKAFRLTEGDYKQALKAASQYPCVPPHAAAIPPASNGVDFCPAAKDFKAEKRSPAPQGPTDAAGKPRDATRAERDHAKKTAPGWRPLNDTQEI
jgi:hypothetical protein